MMVASEIFTISPAGWVLDKRVEYKDATSVLDFDEAGMKVLVVGRGDLFPSALLIDVFGVAKSRRIGSARNHGAFLSFDPTARSFGK